jgi:predicted TIM-barrel fold metal-dependent hydrolase
MALIARLLPANAKASLHSLLCSGRFLWLASGLKPRFKPMRIAICFLLLPFNGLLLPVPSLQARDEVAEVRRQADQWRAEHRTIDMHVHIESNNEQVLEQRYRRALKIMDAAGLGIGVNLSGGTVTRGTNGGPSVFETSKAMADRLAPGRFLLYFNLDYAGWNRPDWSERAVKQVEEAHRLGAAGLKEYKRLGLYLRDGVGKLIKIDDPKLDSVWRRCGELEMPVSIHVGDPKAFWLPYNEKNERWKELKDHRAWWFGDTNIYPPRMELVEALDRVIARHRGTKFVCVHFANNPEDIDWVDKALDRNPNMMADLAARMPELGRHDPKKVHKLFVKHQNRIVFATDFMVYDKLILGSSGDAERPTDRDAEIFYEKEWRWLETWDKDWPHMTPIQGDWTISSIGLPASVLRKIYFDNARKLLARSLPPPTVKAARIDNDFEPDGMLDDAVWQKARSAHVEYGSARYDARPELATSVRVLCSDQFLYFGWECPFTKLTVFDTPCAERERLGTNAPGKSATGALWERDVVEVFVGSSATNINRYAEYEVAPTNERLDVLCNLPEKNFAWDGRGQSAVKVDKQHKVFTVEMRMPLELLSATKPKPGTRWRLNLYRCDKANDAYLAWSPTLNGTFHTPGKFGVLEFAE